MSLVRISVRTRSHFFSKLLLRIDRTIVDIAGVCLSLASALLLTKGGTDSEMYVVSVVFIVPRL